MRVPDVPIVTMEVDATLELDTDTNASIISESLFGTKFIRLDIGGGDAIIEDGGSIFYTEASLIIGDLLNMIVARGKSRAGKDNSDGR